MGAPDAAGRDQADAGPPAPAAQPASPAEEARRREFVESARRTFARCSTRHGAAQLSCRIAGRNVAFRIAGQALGPLLTPAIAHLEAPAPAPPDLTVCAWDTTTTEFVPPPPPWRGDRYLGNGGIRGWDAGPVCAAFDVPSGMLSLFDAERHEAFLWVRDLAALPGYVIAAPFRVIFQWWAAGRGMQLAHAAAVGTERGGVLLAGSGGAGKSTTALLAMLDGLLYAGDDYVLVDPNGEPRAHSLYSSGKLDPSHLVARVAGLAAVAEMPARPERDKAVVYLHRHWPDRIAASLPIRAVLVPRVAGSARTRVAAATRGEAMRALLPHSIFPLPGARHAALARLSSLVRAVPVLRLELGTDVEAVAGVVREVLAGAGG